MNFNTPFFILHVLFSFYINNIILPLKENTNGIVNYLHFQITLSLQPYDSSLFKIYA